MLAPALSKEETFCFVLFFAEVNKLSREISCETRNYIQKVLLQFEESRSIHLILLYQCQLVYLIKNLCEHRLFIYLVLCKD